MSAPDVEAEGLFGALPVDDEDTMARLQARLGEAAARDGLLDVAYREVATPVGSLLLAATEEGLVRVAYESQDHDRVLATLAELVSPRAVRAVGTACALNPLPVVVPCHRVIRSDGSLGQYAGGAAAKEALLRLEGAK